MTTERKIANLKVFPIGLGCMGLSHGYGGPVSEEQASKVLLGALDSGVTLFDTAALYGFGANESLLGRILAPHRSKFVLASKCGIFRGPDGKRAIDGRPETIRKTCEDSLQRLQTDVIDLYYLHRWDKSVPLEDSVGALADLVQAGKIKNIGLSEVSAASLRKAHAIHPIAAVQNEYSLWSRNVELGVLQACQELNVALVAFSPLGRGFFPGTLELKQLADNDLRHRMPRFQADSFAKNQALLQPLRQLATQLDCTPGQLSLAWLLHKADNIIPIPGTTSAEHLQENIAAANLKLDTDTCTQLAKIFDRKHVAGGRYPAASLREIDTEQFPDE